MDPSPMVPGGRRGDCTRAAAPIFLDHDPAVPHASDAYARDRACGVAERRRFVGGRRQQGSALAPRRCAALMYLDTHPNASNREIADAIGMSDEAQASRLLARMEDLGLIGNRTQYNPGTPNAWRLTADGRRLVAALESAQQLT